MNEEDGVVCRELAAALDGLLERVLMRAVPLRPDDGKNGLDSEPQNRPGKKSCDDASNASHNRFLPENGQSWPRKSFASLSEKNTIRTSSICGNSFMAVSTVARAIFAASSFG